MNQQQFARQYLEKQIQNASPAQQIVMLYEGAIKFTTQAKIAIEKGDIQARCNANSRSIEIIAYLLEILDIEKGEEIAIRLHKIYAHLLKLTLKIDFENSTEAADEIIGHLRTLHQTCKELAEQGTKPTPQQESASANPKGKSGPYGTSSDEGELLPVRRSATA